MEKLLVTKEALYSSKESKDKLYESLIDNMIHVTYDENLLNEGAGSMKLKINRKEFKELFGKDRKPKKGDVISIENTTRKYKVKKSKKFNAKKMGKGYNLTIKEQK